MNSPLAGKRIVNTRAVHQAESLNVLLRERGAVPLAYPCIAIAPPEDSASLDAAICNAVAGGYDWLVLTSANTALILAQRLTILGLSLSSAPHLRAAAIGPATAEAARNILGVEVDAMPEAYAAESLAQVLNLPSGTRVLLPESALARPTLAEALKSAGAEVTVIEAYRTVRGSGGVDLPRLLAEGQVDAIAFTSPSTVENCLQRLATEGGSHEALAGVCIACIGPTTAQAARERGLAVSVAPETHTLEGLAAGLERHFENERIGAQ